MIAGAFWLPLTERLAGSLAAGCWRWKASEMRWNEAARAMQSSVQNEMETNKQIWPNLPPASPQALRLVRYYNIVNSASSHCCAFGAIKAAPSTASGQSGGSNARSATMVSESLIRRRPASHLIGAPSGIFITSDAGQYQPKLWLHFVGWPSVNSVAPGRS